MAALALASLAALALAALASLAPLAVASLALAALASAPLAALGLLVTNQRKPEGATRSGLEVCAGATKMTSPSSAKLARPEEWRYVATRNQRRSERAETWRFFANEKATKK